MLLLKSKKKKLILLFLFFILLTTYNTDKDIFKIFRIEKIVFKNSNLLEIEVKNQVSNYLNEKSLLSFNYHHLNNLLFKSYWVNNYKIKKKYPNQILIFIDEIQPIAYYKYNNNYFFLNSNLVKTKTKITDKTGIPFLSGDYSKKNLENIFSSLNNHPKLSNKIRHIKFLDSKRWDLFIDEVKIQLGRHNLDQQLSLAYKILKQKKDIKILDMRIKNRIVITKNE
ncbi:MAG: hypothetical protein CMI81_01570 [Candidatus Pelagibacter sp.]|nr:hypothetical protein [Candidatus Pelagibacter sp.]OUV98031.1 MAG: hypothetical protein CBD02_02185 [Candidatus Pelagibacter sp. TMED142]